MDKPVLESKCTLYLASFHVSNVSGGWLCPVTWSDPNVEDDIRTSVNADDAGIYV